MNVAESKRTSQTAHSQTQTTTEYNQVHGLVQVSVADFEAQRQAWVEWTMALSDASLGHTLPPAYVDHALMMALTKVGPTVSIHERDLDVKSAMSKAVFHYAKLVARTAERANAEFTGCFRSVAHLHQTVVEALNAAVEDCALVLSYPPPLGLDPFADCIWPTTMKNLGAALGITIVVDTHRFQNWVASL